MTATLPAAARAAAVADASTLTVGVEEEFLLLHPETGVNLPLAEQVAAALPDDTHPHSRLEMRRSILQMASSVQPDLTKLRRELLALRRTAADATARLGAQLVAVGATPVAEPDRTPPSKPRYRAMIQRYGPVALDPAVCGLHVHVGVPDRDLAVEVCNRLQVWLPVIRAMTANSPFYRGADTGHASWRSVQLQRWPSLGPTPHFASAADYDRTIADLTTAGVILDDAMVYWYARLSPTYPTVEVRVGDACPTVDDTILATALIRAAVTTAIADTRAGQPAPQPRDSVTAAAHWHAARHGLSRTLIDLRIGRARPAWELVNECFATVSPALLHTGDLDLVVDQLARLRTTGNGATRQRDVYQRTGSIPAVLRHLAEHTTGAVGA